MKILVTGTAGFIGFHLANALVARGDEVIGVDSINDYYDPALKFARLENAGLPAKAIGRQVLSQSLKHPNYRFFWLNIENSEALDTLFKEHQFDAVCHLAAQAGVRYSLENPMAYVHANIVGFANMLESCRRYGVTNLSYASSSSVYGLNESYPLCTNDNVDHPVSLYAASKKTNELMAHTYSHLYGIATTGLRFFTVYGPWGRPDMAYFLFTKAALENRPIYVFNHGRMLRDFTYIDDVVDGVMKAIDHPAQADSNWSGKTPNPATSSAPYAIYNIANSQPVRLMDFIDVIEAVLGHPVDKHMMPMQPGDVLGTHANIDDSINDLGYQPKTPLRFGIEKFIQWYRQFTS